MLNLYTTEGRVKVEVTIFTPTLWGKGINIFHQLQGGVCIIIVIMTNYLHISKHTWPIVPHLQYLSGVLGTLPV